MSAGLVRANAPRPFVAPAVNLPRYMVDLELEFDQIEQDESGPPAPLPIIDLARAAGIEPDPWQQQVLESTHDRLLLNCSRQVGKSQMAALCALDTALRYPASLVLLTSRAQRQSGELMQKVTGAYWEAEPAIGVEAESALQLRLKNRSRIIALPGKGETIRSYSGVKLVVIDEAAFIPDDLYLTVLPMLAVSRGRFIACSTPHGKRGWFYEAWEHGGERWERYRVTAAECSRITPEFLAEMRDLMGEWWFQQEFEGAFLDSESSVFNLESVEQAFAGGMPPLFEDGLLQALGASVPSTEPLFRAV